MAATPAYRTILVGVDHSPLSATALEAAAALANRLGTERVRLVRVVEPIAVGWDMAPYGNFAPGFTALWDAALQGAQGELDAVECAPVGARVERNVRVGSPARELAADAMEAKADLIVVASHDRSRFARVIIGSVASTLLRVAHCPVLVVGHDRPGVRRFERILAAVDLSPVSENVLRNAIAIGAPQEASIEVLSLFEPPLLPSDLPSTTRKDLRDDIDAHRERVAELINRIRDARVPIRPEVLSTAPAHRAIVDVAQVQDADLVVVGASGHNAWHRFFLGSTATRVVIEAPCPVLVVPHDAAILQPNTRGERSPESLGSAARACLDT
jgi:nucleotide-binding universal stress UspA family protein